MMLDWQGALDAVVHHPLFGIGLTLAAYQLVLAAYDKTRWIFLQPVLVSMLLVIGVLLACGIDYSEYRNSTQIMNTLLGPATVAWRCLCTSTCGASGSCSGPSLLRW